jgi:hypothetical protein
VSVEIRYVCFGCGHARIVQRARYRALEPEGPHDRDELLELAAISAAVRVCELHAPSILGADLVIRRRLGQVERTEQDAPEAFRRRR